MYGTVEQSLSLVVVDVFSAHVAFGPVYFNKLITAEHISAR